MKTFKACPDTIGIG
jgi:hypothetical protein